MRNKLFIFIMGLILLIALVWNPPYIYWHLWVKWHLQDYSSLYFIPQHVSLEQKKPLSANWCYADFIETKIPLPKHLIKAKKIDENGIFICFEDFCLAITDFSECNNNKSWIKDLHEISEKGKVPDYVGDNYYRLLILQTTSSPNQLSFLDGSIKTNRLIYLLKSKYYYFSSVSNGSIFKTAQSKGVLIERLDGSYHIAVFSNDESKCLTMNLVFNKSKKLSKPQKDVLIYNIVGGFYFFEEFSTLPIIKERIDEIVNTNIIQCDETENDVRLKNMGSGVAD